MESREQGWSGEMVGFGPTVPYTYWHVDAGRWRRVDRVELRADCGWHEGLAGHGYARYAVCYGTPRTGSTLAHLARGRFGRLASGEDAGCGGSRIED